MEGAVTNLCSPGDEVIVRQRRQVRRALGEARRRRTGWWPTRFPSSGAARCGRRRSPRRSRRTRGRASSTCRRARRRPACSIRCPRSPSSPARATSLLVVDGITAVGAVDLPMDRLGIDVLVTGSQKALMLPPGLAFIALSSRAWAAAQRATLPRFYFDLARERKGVAETLDRVDAGDLAHPGPARRARDDAQRGLAERLRAPRSPRARDARRRDGDRAPAAGAGRAEPGGDGGPPARRASTAARCSATCATACGSRSRAARTS